MGARPKAKMSSYGRFRDGVSLAGIPISTPEGGQVFWVDSNGPGTGGSAGQHSRNLGTWKNPFLTIDKALDYVVADRGDVIFCKPKHAETVTTTVLNFDKAGTYVIGLGIYDQRPRLLVDGAAGTLTFSAADVWFENFVIASGHADLTACTVTAKGCHLINLVFEEGADDENFAIQISTSAVANACDGLVVAGCSHYDTDAGNKEFILIQEAIRDIKIIGNACYGDQDASPYGFIQDSGKVCNNALVADNMLYNAHDGNTEVGIVMDNTASYGWMIGNFCQHLDTVGYKPFLGGTGGMCMHDNFQSTVKGTTSGLLYPAVDS